uniref:NADH dehydrogenase subunit 5 n=1 Tax=Synelmis amoureuxi TaxID=3053537 RepID=UPI0030E2AFE1
MTLNLNTSIIIQRTLWSSFTIMLITAMWLTATQQTVILEWEMMTFFSTPLKMMLIMDPLGTIFSSAVMFISANVFSFSNTYMSDEPFKKRFALLVLSFILSMNFLIFIPHLMGLLLGWDGLGITSFILVIYYQNPKSLAAGMITALTNRIGDVMILLTIAWSLNQGHWSILNMWDSTFSSIMTLTIMIAAMTKSAQMPFSSWLPAAMAAPTPVSALVHSSTLVTAGVFLLIRFYPFLHKTSWFNMSVLIIATLTMLMAGLSAMAECDLKKIIALSTLSQLGVMMASLGLNLPTLAFFHLITHALFKALLFICAGNIIQLHHHSQDLRLVGNLTSQMPMTTTSLLTANMALSGLPFMAGFYSKDLIIEMALFNPSNMLILFMFILATLLTASYSIRMMVTCLWSPCGSLPAQYIQNEDHYITNPMMFLSLGAISMGSVINWLLVSPYMEPYLPLHLKLLALTVTLLGAYLSFQMSSGFSTMPAELISFQKSHHSQALMWFLTPLSTQGMLKSPFMAAHQSLKSVDQGWFELIGPQGIMSFVSLSAKKNTIWQSNLITSHLTLTTLFITLMMMYIL